MEECASDILIDLEENNFCMTHNGTWGIEYPVLKAVISLYHPKTPDTQGHSVIPMIPKLLNELTLYREALNEITKALNECGPSSGALLHIRNIIAPFDYAQMECVEE